MSLGVAVQEPMKNLRRIRDEGLLKIEGKEV